jgi:hypothetical protein
LLSEEVVVAMVLEGGDPFLITAVALAVVL